MGKNRRNKGKICSQQNASHHVQLESSKRNNEEEFINSSSEMVEYPRSRTPQFEGTNLIIWKHRMETYLLSLGSEVWVVVEKGCTTSATSPSTLEEKKALESNTRAINAIFNNFPNKLITKVIHYSSAKEVWDKLTEMNQNSEL